MIEHNLLVKKTIEALNERCLKNPLDDSLHSIRDVNSIWSLIVFKCIGSYSQSENVCIYFNWKRNVKNYADEVLDSKELGESYSSNLIFLNC